MVVTDWPLRYPCGVDVVTVAVEPLEGAVETKVLASCVVSVTVQTSLPLNLVGPVTVPEAVLAAVPAAIALEILMLVELRLLQVPVAPLIATLLPLRALVIVGPEV